MAEIQNSDELIAAVGANIQEKASLIWWLICNLIRTLPFLSRTQPDMSR